jgi:acyl phosphate:glycerol-3-phosphate acyltransferase
MISVIILLPLIASFFLGSIPFGFIVARIWKIDIRRYGSGNIGATNVFRTLGPVAGIFVFVLDLLKGTAAILLLAQFTNNHWLIILGGILAILGHTFSPFLKFKGGRGSATGLGVLLGIAPEIFLIAFIIVACIVALTRYVSLASVLTPPIVLAIFVIQQRPLPYTLAVLSITLLIIYRHIPNIKRLLNKTENKVW